MTDAEKLNVDFAENFLLPTPALSEHICTGTVATILGSDNAGPRKGSSVRENPDRTCADQSESLGRPAKT